MSHERNLGISNSTKTFQKFCVNKGMTLNKVCISTCILFEHTNLSLFESKRHQIWHVESIYLKLLKLICLDIHLAIC